MRLLHCKINHRRLGLLVKFLNQGRVKFRKRTFIGYPKHFRKFYMNSAMVIAYFLDFDPLATIQPNKPPAWAMGQYIMYQQPWYQSGFEFASLNFNVIINIICKPSSRWNGTELSAFHWTATTPLESNRVWLNKSDNWLYKSGTQESRVKTDSCEIC